MPALPALADVRAWIGVPATLISDPQLDQVLSAEAALQARLCRIDSAAAQLPEHLIQALYRRVGREIAAKAVPLGMLGADSEWGPARLPRWDAEIDRLEGPDRMVIFG